MQSKEGLTFRPLEASAAKLHITTAITTLDYYILSISLHAAHIVGYKERGTNVIAADVICNAADRELKVMPVSSRLFLTIQKGNKCLR